MRGGVLIERCQPLDPTDEWPDPEVVRCQGCCRLLRRRPRLTPEQRAQAPALQWAADQLEEDPAAGVLRRCRKSRDADDTLAYALLRVADRLRARAHTTHKRTPIVEREKERRSA